MKFCDGCGKELTGVIFNCDECGADFCVDCWDSDTEKCLGCAEELFADVPRDYWEEDDDDEE